MEEPEPVNSGATPEQHGSAPAPAVEIGNDNAVPRHRLPDARSGSAKAQENPVGQVLRSIYQQTVSEDIPAEMLDLLSKLD